MISIIFVPHVSSLFLTFELDLYRTLPAGFLEMGESAAEGAMRETYEEAGAEVEIMSPYAQLDIPLIGQVRKERLSFQHVSLLPFVLLF